MSFSATLVRCSKKHSPSSKRWLQRQYRDPLVKMRNAHPVIYRSRSAFKLLDLDSKFNFLVHSDVQTVIDLGAAPGGWSQVVSGKLGWVVEDVVSSRSLKKAKDLGYQSETLYAGFGLEEKSKSDKYGSWSSPNQEATQDLDIYSVLDEEEQVQQGRGTIIAVDILPISPIPGVKTLQMDFLTRQAEQYINALIEDREDPNAVGKADVVLSDIAANFSGNRTRDVASNLRVAEAVFAFAKRHLKTAKESGRTRGGVLVMKYFDHPYLERFKKEFLSPHFRWCYHCKPESSRRESAEGYWVCLGFNGVDGS